MPEGCCGSGLGALAPIRVPVCYGQGGTEPTVTDANLILGYLNPEFFLGGRMQLDRSWPRRLWLESPSRSGSTSLRPQQPSIAS